MISIMVTYFDPDSTHKQYNSLCFGVSGKKKEVYKIDK